MRKEKISYDQAMKELEQIVTRIDGGQVDVDELATSVKRAVELVRTCRERLKSTQDEVELALKEMDAEVSASAACAPEPVAPAAAKVAAPNLLLDDGDPFADE